MADVTQSTLNGLFKELYADQINNLLPESARLTKTIGFSRNDRTGNQYHQPVILSRPAGFTYGGQGTTSTAYTLNSGVSLQMKDAVVTGAEMTDREVIAYGVMARAANGDRASFMDATTLVIEQMMDTMTYRVELSSLYGGSGIGKCASSANADTTNTVVTLTVASSSLGIFSGAENATLNFIYSGTPYGSTAADQIFTINKIAFTDANAPQVILYISGTTNGISALDTGIAAHANLVDVYFNGQYGNEPTGVDRICTLGLSGGPTSLYGITAADFSLWNGNSYDAGSAALTMGKVLSGAGRLAYRGLKSAVEVHVNPVTWQNLNNDLAALHRFNEAGGKQDVGAEEICYYGPTGEVRIVGNIFVKQGEAFMLADPSRAEYWKRIGSTDITFTLPGRQDEFFLNSPDKNGYELRNYTDQSIFCPVPAKNMKFKNIVNN